MLLLRLPSFVYLSLLVEKLWTFKVSVLQNCEDFFDHQMNECFSEKILKILQYPYFEPM